jgi:hypothetical protein
MTVRAELSAKYVREEHDRSVHWAPPCIPIRPCWRRPPTADGSSIQQREHSLVPSQVRTSRLWSRSLFANRAHLLRWGTAPVGQPSVAYDGRARTSRYVGFSVIRVRSRRYIPSPPIPSSEGRRVHGLLARRTCSSFVAHDSKAPPRRDGRRRSSSRRGRTNHHSRIEAASTPPENPSRINHDYHMPNDDLVVVVVVVVVDDDAAAAHDVVPGAAFVHHQAGRRSMLTVPASWVS